MPTQDLMLRNRVIFTHFGSYSIALVLPRWGATLLWPEALPDGALPMTAPPSRWQIWSAESVKQAAVERCGLRAEELVSVNAFEHWAQTSAGPVRVHLLQFTTADVSKALMEALGGVFKSINELRLSAMSELLLREVFDLIVGAGPNQVRRAGSAGSDAQQL